MRPLLFLLCSTLLLLLLSANMKRVVKWEHLGTRTVDMTLDHDEITINTGDGKYNTLKITVTRTPLYLQSCKIVFANGEDSKIEIEKELVAGTSHLVDIPGELRVIKKILFHYNSTTPTNKKAVVTIYGMR